MTRITPHFTYEEAAQRKWHSGPAVPYPEEWVDDILTTLYLQMEIIRAVWNRPIKLSSVYRSPAYNTAIKGKPKSLHMAGRACDFKVAGIPAAVVHAKVMELVATGKLPLIRGVGKYPTFVHVDTRQTVKLATWDETRRSNIPK